MIQQLFQKLHPGRGHDLQTGQLIVEFQRPGGGQAVTLSQLNDQRAVRCIHEKRTQNDAAQQRVLHHQRKRDVIEVSQAGEYVRLADLLGTLSRFYLQLQTGASGHSGLFQQGTKSRLLPEGLQQCAILFNKLNGDLGVCLQGLQDIPQTFLRDPGINAAAHRLLQNFHN